MHSKSRWRGAALMTLGVLGTLICLIGMVVLWSVWTRLAGAVEQTFDRVDVALTRIEDRTVLANERIAGVKDSLHDLNDRVQLRVAQRQGVETEDAADIDEIERRLRARIVQIQSWVEFTQSSVELIQQLLAMLDASSSFLQSDERTLETLAASVQAGRQEIDVASRMFDEVQAGLIEIRAHRDVESTASRITTLTSRIGESVTKIEGHGKTLRAKLGASVAEIADLGRQIRGRLTLYTVIATLFIAWMALGQVGLFVLGRRSLC